MGVRKLTAALALLAAAACQSHGTPSGPAFLASDDADNMTALQAGLAAAMGRASVELGAGDPLSTGAVAVLPPPVTSPEDRSLAMPVMFDLEMRDGECVAVRRDSGSVHDLPGVQCVIAPVGDD